MMVSEPQNADPFQNHSLLSLFPRAIPDSKLIHDSDHSDDLDSIHIYMKSMALVSSDKLFEEAKTVADGLAPSSGVPLKSTIAEGKEDLQVQRVPLALKQDQFSSNVNKRLHNDQLMKQVDSFMVHDKHDASKNDNESVVAKGKENPQLRRPDLGLNRKKARFSLNPNSSQPSINLEPTEEMYQLQDPEEFFSAFQNLENARKEIERQTGNNMGNAKANNPPTSRRRPGILGRSVSYKHSYSSMLSESDGVLTSLQEETCDTHDETTNLNAQSEKKTLEGSPAEKKNRVDEVVDDILFSRSQNLTDEEALSQVQEYLHIKPIDLDIICHPKYHDTEIPEFDNFGEKFPQAQISYKDKMEIGSSSRTPLQNKKVADSPVNPLTSPTPPKSPFASISLLKRRLSQKSPLNDLFSSRNIDEHIANIPLFEQLDQQSGNVDTCQNSRDSPPIEIEIMHENPSEHELEFAAGLSESHADVENHDIGADNNNDMKDVVKDILQEAACGDTNISIRGSSGSHEISHAKQNGSIAGDENVRLPLSLVENMYKEAEPIGQPDAHIEKSTMENSNSGTPIDEQNSSVNHTTVRPTATPEVSRDVQHKESRVPVNVKRTSKGPRKSKVLNHRQSLADAGSLWNTGVRRSSRIKRKPLEYWKGERFLYGRVHGSLPTVIGIKYLSPGKESMAKPTFRVQSFVSDDYKDLVDLAALH